MALTASSSTPAFPQRPVDASSAVLRTTARANALAPVAAHIPRRRRTGPSTRRGARRTEEEKATKAREKEEAKVKGEGRTVTKEEEQDRREEQLQPQAVLPLMLRPLERAGTLLLPQGSITVLDSPGRELHWTHGPTSG